MIINQILMNILLQVIETGTSSPVSETTSNQSFDTLSLLALLMKGGPIMVPIAILSIIAIYIFIERYLAIRKAAREESNFMNQIRDYIYDGKIDAAKALCRSTENPVARMIDKGIARIGKSVRDIETSVENVGKLEIYKLEKNLATLATIAGAAPMIGFLGTVSGMIKAFYNMSKAGNNIDITLLAGGIYEAMVTTLAGLAVGIIAYIGYNMLVAMVEKVVYKMEARTIEFLDLLQEPAK
jgi:biopolymer transport protein ExbB